MNSLSKVCLEHEMSPKKINKLERQVIRKTLIILVVGKERYMCVFVSRKVR